ncbi:MAG: YdcF family protein [Elusimicrobia bacterium]|nr:YdcF family protein [Elusimicrobiota bacterium]
MTRPFQRPLLHVIGLLIMAAPLLLGAYLFAVGWWLDFSEEPRPSDMMVVLAGNFSRPPHAAQLFKNGVAPEIWLARPARPADQRLVDAMNIPYPKEEDINREMLLRLGVPARNIKFYGQGVKSTAEEALAFAAEARPAGKKVLVVTSKTHARRARSIFRALVSGAEIRVTATPHDPFERRWWRDQDTARAAVLEPAKMLFFWFGGKFLAAKERYP